MALMAGPSHAGEWTAVVGVPDFGLEAAAAYGLDLDRTVIVPRPGEHWLSVAAGLLEVATVVAIRPPARVTEHQAERLRARLRQKDAALDLPGRTGPGPTPPCGSSARPGWGWAAATGT